MSLRFVILFLTIMALVPYAARAVIPYAARAIARRIPIYSARFAGGIRNAARRFARARAPRFTLSDLRKAPMLPILGGSAVVGTGTGVLSEAVDRWGDPGPSVGDPPLVDDSHMLSHIGDGLRRSRLGVPDSVANEGMTRLVLDPTIRRRRRPRRVVYRRSRRRYR